MKPLTPTSALVEQEYQYWLNVRGNGTMRAARSINSTPSRRVAKRAMVQQRRRRRMESYKNTWLQHA